MSDLKGKKLLLMGGVNAIHVAERAKELGVHVIVTDYLVNSPVKKFADESYLVSTTDVEAVTELARKLKVDGVFTAFTDWMLPYCRQICDNLNLPFYASAEQIDILTNKDKFKKICAEHELQVVKQYELNNQVDNDNGQVNNIEYPVIVKPVDSGGGKGIYICYTEKELRERYLDSLSFSKSKKVIIEEYMESDQVILFYTIQDSYVSLSAMCNLYTNKEQRGFAPIPTAMTFPSNHLANFKHNDHQKVVNLIEALNIKNGVLFIQAFMNKERICIHEAGFRFIGALTHKVLKEINGVDTVEMMIRYALTGETKGVNLKELDKPEFDKWVCILIQAARGGKIASISGFDEIANLSEIFGIYLKHREGDSITQIGTLDQCMSKEYIKTETKSELARIIDEINSTIQVKNEKGENMLLTPFNPYSF